MELLDLRYDAAFKEFFKDKELLSSFISTITEKELEIESLEYTEEKAIDDGRSIIFDILAIDKDGNKINVEMEKNSTTSIKKRTQFYWAKAFTRGFEKKSKFKDLKQTICINILGNNVFKDDVICREYVIYDVENQNRLDDSLSIYFVELQKGEKSSGENLKDLWIKLLANSKKVNDIPKEVPIIKKAVSKVHQISEIDDIQFKVIQEALEESKRLDWQDDVIEEANEKAKEEAKKIYTEKMQEIEVKMQKEMQEIREEMQEKVQQEIQEIKETMQEKIYQEKVTLAKSLLDVLDDETISSKTGLDIDFIKSLRL